MSEIADSILDAVEILVDKKTSDLQFNKTIRGKISEIIDESIGKYKIQYQNSYFTAYSSDSNATYQKGSEVYVEILSSDFEKNALILGTVRRLGSNYITIIEKLDKYSNVGAEADYSDGISFCSYGGSQVLDLTSLWDQNKESLLAAAAQSDALKLGVKIKNTLSAAQRAAQGNFGIKIIAKYYDEAELDSLPTGDRNTLTREYLFDVNDMTGQPYKYTVATDQYAIFDIDAKNFIGIESIEAFCKDFIEDSGKDSDDIWFSNIHLQFLHSLTEEQLQTTSLSIETPNGNYFSTTNSADKILKADLRVKGKKVNYDAQQIDFYWFRRNLRVNSTHEAFSAYGGNGWELLNKTSLNAYKYTLNKDLCTTEETEFKCVAVFSDNGQVISLSSNTTIKNFVSSLKLYIDSSAGTTFAFNIGKTTLTLQGYTATSQTRYCWTESIDGSVSAFVNGNELVTNNNIDVTIATPAASLLKYECSVYEADDLVGTAAITLTNNKENLGYTLVINNGTQIFKYDEYGVSPASTSFALADRMIIPALSFSIYDKQGQLVNIADSDKTRYMTIRWIWPAAVGDSNAWKQTMLDIDSSLLSTISIRDIANNRTEQRYAIVNQPTLVYGIRDQYNAELANTESSYNNIKLEVEYQSEYLTASTNFTFTKEGELGTNGTRYIARIEPQDQYKEIFICGRDLYAAQYINKAESTDKVTLVNLGAASRSISSLFKAHLWNGAEDVINQAQVTWSIASSTKRAGNSRLTISGNNVKINSSGVNSNILQATITYGNLKFYATYPIIYTTALSSNRFLYIDGGYREVMYESDGTRGKFNGLPFKPKWLSSAGKADTATVNTIAWTSSWNAAAAQVPNSFNQFTIEPPTYFIAEETGAWIRLQLGNISTYLPIELYLNRYGMSAMNDWDGNSIQISNDGGYILSPQVGAGRKESDNSFTGITIGEVFQDQNNKEIGMFGYYQGQRSLFLDAETGSAEFGIEGRGRIKIDTQNNEGVIDSGDYNITDKTGLKIKFTSTGDGNEKGPYIRYGSGNFTVNADGNLVAKGGGTIAGWQISDNALTSSDNKTILYSDDIAHSTTADKLRLNINNKFKIYEDGRFSASNNKFSVASDGTIVATGGTIGGWTINTDNLSSDSQAITLTKTGYILGPENNNSPFTINNTKRTWGITPGGVAHFTDVKIKNTPNKASNKNTFQWQSGTPDSQGNYPKIFELTDTGSNIGGWNITGNQLSSTKNNKTMFLNSANVGTGNAVLSVADVFKVYGNGNISATGGSIGGCSINGSGIYGSGYQLDGTGIKIGNDYLTVNDITYVKSCTLSAPTSKITLYTTSFVTNIKTTTDPITGAITSVTPQYFTKDFSFNKVTSINLTLKRDKVKVLFSPSNDTDDTHEIDTE